MVLMSGTLSLLATVLFVVWWISGAPDDGALVIATGICLIIGWVLISYLGSLMGRGWIWIVALVATPFIGWLTLMIGIALDKESERNGY